MSIIEILIAVGYLIILIQCITIAFRGNSAISSNQIIHHRIIFASIAVILIIMITARLLHVNNFLTQGSRILAKNEGWYEGRRTIQMLFVSSVIIFGIILTICIERKLSSIWRYYSMTFYGIIFLIGFMVINTVSYHPVDQFLKKEFMGIKHNRTIEFINISWIVISLFFSYRRSLEKSKEVSVIPVSRYI